MSSFGRYKKIITSDREKSMELNAIRNEVTIHNYFNQEQQIRYIIQFVFRYFTQPMF